jgi:hypothetical protein
VYIEDDNPFQMTLVGQYNDYLKYVDIGVGSGTKASGVERGRNVRFRSRYIGSWNRAQGSSHRPAIMAELRHLQTRLRDYLVDFWGAEGTVDILNSFEGLNVDLGKW